MSDPDETRWNVIRGAAAGRPADREEFANRYESIIRTYFAARWRSASMIREVDDATQEVFLVCFREGGALIKADPRRTGGFRAFLYGIVRNVARRIEGQVRTPVTVDMEAIPDSDDPFEFDFDRAWARSLVNIALELQLARAQDAKAERRVEILKLRFSDGQLIRDLAEKWSTAAVDLHHEYAKAREEFTSALRTVVREHYTSANRTVDDRCQDLLLLFF
jgi:DNA-directed RNA polymerase specialized sigma24 family protein